MRPGGPTSTARTTSISQSDIQKLPFPRGRSLAAVAARPRRRFTRLIWALVLLSPTWAAVLYYGAFATDRYVAEARFVIRTASKPANALGGLGALMQLFGMSRSQDDAYAVRDYLTSRNAVAELGRRLDLATIYHQSDADPLVRYPSLLFGPSQEEFYRYFQHRLSVYVDSNSGLTVLDVEAFNGGDAERVAHALLLLGEELINRLNERMLGDAVRVAADEVARAEHRRVESEIAVTDFRNRELMLDPSKSAALLIELIGRLGAELGVLRAEIAETQGNARNSPQLQSMRQRADALERQIVIERGRVSTGSDGLADKIAAYEKLMLEQQFATRALDQARTALEAARTEARRQQLFLERVVEPVVPDEATEPRRLRTIFTVLGFNIIALGISWLIGSGMREHAAGPRA